jgi:hypothetical protein
MEVNKRFVSKKDFNLQNIEVNRIEVVQSEWKPNYTSFRSCLVDFAFINYLPKIANIEG